MGALSKGWWVALIMGLAVSAPATNSPPASTKTKIKLPAPTVIVNASVGSLVGLSPLTAPIIPQLPAVVELQPPPVTELAGVGASALPAAVGPLAGTGPLGATPVTGLAGASGVTTRELAPLAGAGELSGVTVAGLAGVGASALPAAVGPLAGTGPLGAAPVTELAGPVWLAPPMMNRPLRGAGPLAAVGPLVGTKPLGSTPVTELAGPIWFAGEFDKWAPTDLARELEEFQQADREGRWTADRQREYNAWLQRLAAAIERRRNLQARTVEGRP